MAWENLGSNNLGEAQAVVYSIDGGTNFRWARLDGEVALTGLTNYADPALAIEAAWSYLNTKGGGVLRTRGPGETWTVATVIDSQGANVTWKSDKSLTITIPNTFDDNVVSITHDDVTVIRVHVNGNRLNQSAPVGVGPNGFYIYECSNVKLFQCKITDCRQFGVYVRATEGSNSNVEVRECELIDNDWNGIWATGRDYYTNFKAIGNTIEGWSDVGISSGLDRTVISNNYFNNVGFLNRGAINTSWAIGLEVYVDSVELEDIIIEENIIVNCDTGIGFQSSFSDSFTRIKIANNVMYNLEIGGVYAQYVDWMEITGNIIEEWDTLNAWGSAIYCANEVEDTLISDNILFSRDARTRAEGIRLRNNSDRVKIKNNVIRCYLNCIWLDNDVDDTEIHGNTLVSGNSYSIQIDDATIVRTRIGKNDMYGTNQCLNDNAPLNTILPSKEFQFIKELNGTYNTTSPTGIEISAATHTAILQGHIPQDAQQVVRIRIFAVALGAPVGAGGQMHLEITFNAGTPNAAYNTATKSWNITWHDGLEADYVADDVVTWRVIDANVGNELSNLLPLDKFELLAVYESAADPDGATNAVFGSISIEYV